MNPQRHWRTSAVKAMGLTWHVSLSYSYKDDMELDEVTFERHMNRALPDELVNLIPWMEQNADTTLGEVLEAIEDATWEHIDEIVATGMVEDL